MSDYSIKYLSMDGLAYLWKKINERMNDIVTKGIHNCASCGAPYTGKPICEYCGRGFFVDFNMYKEKENGDD